MLVFKYGLYMPIKIIDKSWESRIGASLFFSYICCYLWENTHVSIIYLATRAPTCLSLIYADKLQQL